jgi:uncharacterized membrane-anchored protein YhcB (DUF1043 family)
MNHHTVLFGTLMAAGIGLVAGWAIGDLVRRYRQGVEQLDTLRRQLPQPYSAVLFQQRQLKEMRSVLNDAHKHILAVSKGLEKPPR